MQDSDILKIIGFHQKIHPGFSALDAYKLIYQRHRGTGHLILDIDSSRKHLLDELEHITPDNSVMLIEPLREDFEVVRVNLVPFKARGLDPEMLLGSFIESSEPSEGALDSFTDEWMNLIWMVKNGLVNLNLDDMEKVNQIVLDNDYPPMHHSEKYTKMNNPSYRISRYGPLITTLPEIECDIKKFKF